MTLKLLSTNTVQVSPHCLVYGKAKAGKTRLALTAPNPVICDTDKGLASVRGANIPYHPVATYDDYLQFESAAVAGEFSGMTPIIDDFTELAEIFLLQEKPKHKNGLQAYGALNDEMNRVVRFWRDRKDCASVILCKEEKILNPSTGLMIYSPKVAGKAVAPDLPYLWGSVYHMEKWIDPVSQQSHEVLRCKENAQYEAGDRSGKLAELELANLSAIFAKIMS